MDGRSPIRMPRWKTALILLTAGLAIPILRLHKIIPLIFGIVIRIGGVGLLILAAITAFSPQSKSQNR